jgi:hypothetical protein
MAWVSRFIAAILVSLITVAVLAQVFDATLLSSKYLTQTASRSGIYSSLSVSLTNQLIKQLNSHSSVSGPVTPQQTAVIQSVITPGLIKTKVDSALTGIQAYYKNNGPTPTISLSDVTAQLQAEGLPVATNSNVLTKPININGNQKIREQVKNFEEVKLLATLAAVVLLSLLLFLSWEEHRWKILPDIVIINGAIFGILSLIFIFGIRVVDKYGKLNANSNDLVNTANNYAKALTHGVGEIMGIISVILLVVGIAGRILLRNTGKSNDQKNTQLSKNPVLKLKPALK